MRTINISLIVTLVLSLISIGIFIAIKRANHEKKINVVATFYDGLLLYYYIDARKDNNTNKKGSDNNNNDDDEKNTGNDIIIIENNNSSSSNNNNNNNNCLNGGIPNIKNDTFSECNCPDDKFIGPLCQYQNLMRPADGMTFEL